MSCLQRIIPSWALLLSIWTFLFQGVSMLSLTTINIPSHTIRNQPVRLECKFDLNGEALYSVKWYKDGREFFRILPGDDPPKQAFDQPGIIVDLANSSDTALALKAVDLDGSGVYKCEISGEAPSFQTVSGVGQMQVVDLPNEGPHIDGSKRRYSLGDTVRVNCTSSKSRPAANLSWFVNSEPAEDVNLTRYPTVVYDDGLETAILGLEFKVRHKHFRQGDLKLKCLATIARLYWRSNEESVAGDRPHRTPALESRETFNTEASSHSSSNGVSWIMNQNSSYSCSSSVYCIIFATLSILLNNSFSSSNRLMNSPQESLITSSLMMRNR